MALRSRIFNNRPDQPQPQFETGAAEGKHFKNCNLVPGVQIISYLPLQMGLYFNVCYSPMWVLSLLVGLDAKFFQLESLYKYITVFLYVIMILIEISRLYLGYDGNLREKVSELASFWLLSLLQLPLVIYLMANTNTIILPLEWAINIPMTIFLIYEVITGVVALHLMIKAQGVKFHVSRLHPHFVQMNREEGKDD